MVSGAFTLLARQQLRSDVNEVLSRLNIARSEAIRQRKTVEITIEELTDSFITIEEVTVSFDSLGARENCSPPCQVVLKSDQIGESRTIEITPAGGITVKPGGDPP